MSSLPQLIDLYQQFVFFMGFLYQNFNEALLFVFEWWLEAKVIQVVLYDSKEFYDIKGLVIHI